MTDFYNLVERLTRQHRVAVTTDNGVVFATEDGLLQQLRESVSNSGDSGATSSNKTKLPINAPAFDLLTLIDRQIAEVWATLTRRVPGIDRAETLLTEWAGAVRPETLVTVSSPEMANGQVIWTKAEHTPQALMERWERQITELFDPPRQAEILAACINCGEREVWRVKDGENIKQSALIFVRDRITGDSTEARCLVCASSWSPDQFRYLAEAINENEARHAGKVGVATV